jgi:putative addiction module killer protein
VQGVVGFLQRKAEAKSDGRAQVFEKSALAGRQVTHPNDNLALLAQVYLMNYTCCMYSVEQSKTFKAWLNELRDAFARVRITARLTMAKEGNLGDCKPVGDGVHEMRVHVAWARATDFVHRGERIIFLLLGGNKSSQSRDIKRAKAMAEEIDKE